MDRRKNQLSSSVHSTGVPCGESFFAALAFDQFAFVVIGFVANRVPAFVAIEIEVALLLHRLPDRLARAVVIGIGGADKTVVGNVQNIEQFLEMARHFIRELTRRAADVAGFLGHLQTVFVGPCLEADFTAAQALEAGDNISRDRLVGMADMRLAIGIVDRGGEVIGFSHRLAR